MRVPYDAYQPMVFQGEEIGIGIRGFTHGYDFYAPRDSVVFHEYAVKSSRRNKVHMFWYVVILWCLIQTRDLNKMLFTSGRTMRMQERDRKVCDAELQ